MGEEYMYSDYKFVSKYLEKNKNNSDSGSGFSLLKLLKLLVSKILVCIILIIAGLIVLRYDNNNSRKIYKFIYEDNLSFAKINAFYKKYLGDILPFQSSFNNTKAVFNDEISYQSLNIYKDGVALTVSENYLIPSLDDGIVIYVGEKENYNNTIIVQQANGIDVWYGNVSNSNINIYDYVSKGEILGMTNGNTLYLAFANEEGFVDYKEYF